MTGLDNLFVSLSSREDKNGKAGRVCKTSVILFFFSDRGLLGFQRL